MSRAFVKEDAGGPEALPDLPLSGQPNWVTPSGLAGLRERLAVRSAELAALKAQGKAQAQGEAHGEARGEEQGNRLDRLPEAAAERDIRYLGARLATAILVEPSAAPEEVAFGVTVTVEDEGGRRRTLRIVGEDEADPARGWITAQSPLARALLGLRPGEEADWRGGSLAVVSISP